MVKIKIKMLSKRIGYVLTAAIMLLAYFPNIASAQPITSRSVAIGSSVASTNTTYSFSFTVPQATVIKSVSFAGCTTASGACTAPAGFATPNASTVAQPTGLGDASGWLVSTATAGELRLSKTTNVAAPTGAQTVTFSNVRNPNATNATFYIKITTFSDAAWTTAIDSGVVASSTAGQTTVTASVNETLTFTLADSSVALGTVTTSSTGTGTSTMIIATNAKTGYSVNYQGTTLTSGTSTIPAMASLAASVQNSKQFGINMMANTTPSVGSNVTGTGSGAVSAGYNTANQYKFNVAGDVIASASVPTNTNTFTTSYIANIDGETPAGSYATIIIYMATANF